MKPLTKCVRDVEIKRKNIRKGFETPHCLLKVYFKDA